MNVQRLVDAYIIGLGDNSDNSSLLQALTESITSGHISLLELVQALGSYLASEEASRRSKGVNVLSDVLNNLPTQAIPSQATEKLIEFFCARLADATCVSGILTSINALLRLPSLTDKLTVGVLNALFRDVHVQSFQYSTRSTAYKLLEIVIQSHPEAVKAMGDDFVLGFAQMLDGEKDPRSLIVAFQIVPKIVGLVDVKNNAEDLFDVIFCYFPITFKHRDGDPSAISPDSLKTALRAALTCTPYFGGMSVKPLVNKTSATSPSVKVDAFETLTAGSRVYSPDDFKPELETLVEQIREDVVMAASEDVVNAALDTLEAIYGAISPAAPSPSSPGNRIADITENSSPLDFVLKEAVFQLTADEVKNPEQVGRILRAAARSSAYNCSIVSDAVIPIIVERLNNTDALTVRRELMDVLNYILSASCDVERKAECLDADKLNLLNIYRPETAVPVDNEHSFSHIVRLKGITLLILLPRFLDGNEAAVALQTLASAAIEHNEDENVNKEGAHLLVQLAQSKPEQIKSIVLPMFFGALRESMISIHKVTRLLNTLGAIGVATSDVLLTLLQGLASLVTSNDLASGHPALVVSTIRKVIEAVAAADRSTVNVFQELLALVVAPVSDWLVGMASTKKPLSDQLIAECAKAVVAVFSKLDAGIQAEKLKPLFDRFLPAITSTNESDLCPALPLFSAAVCSCWPQTNIPVDNIAAFVDGLVTASLATNSDVHRNACLEIVASIINKTKSSPARGDLVKAALKHYELADVDVSEPVVLLHHWVARALVNCNDSVGYTCISWLISQITQSSLLSRSAAEGFSIVLGDHNWAVTQATHGVFKLLSKQRFYTTVLPEITAAFNQTESDNVKANLLVVLTNVVQHTPKSVLMNGITETVPLLLSAIRLTDGDLKAASIRTITMIILETPETLNDDIVNSVIPLLLDSTVAGNKSNTVEVRRAAHSTLTLIPEKYSFSLMQPLRKNVVRALASARDDRKRLVRSDAVKAYNKWLKFGEE
ncbi:hypothetical protein GGI25_002322 [Coemansia spiralis]|uniref:MMS19 nucleotide excision repair protein n=2 Tax=Coemansia TaxID=4863 RepID=A0A9W8G9B3_9FUNG|nr:Dos2-interacting transcription regulator of RNA-Pol-II-domain-containing protein [Coemansia spiralis]KAJ1989574.1 hypothetical protein EDC05_004608 [Coemansia umbellata]KAJ2625710.1 hypothetical protein GGI26_000510 [Coemansia sp. RSA 1358]KAJ2678528.1 hypothetical protein GGI25_002322 [Coemansia spiralis]